MKWFQHYCNLKNDPRVMELLLAYQAQGYGVFMLIMEILGVHSDLFAIKVTGVPDYDPAGTLEYQEKLPTYSLVVLSSAVSETPETVLKIIEKCAEVDLYDLHLWRTCRVIYSTIMRHSADEYTRRISRNKRERPDELRISSEESSTKSKKVLLQDITGQDKNINNPGMAAELSTLLAHVGGESQDQVVMSESEFQLWSAEIKDTIARWTKKHSRSLGWEPTEGQLRKLAYGGKWRHRQRQSYEATNVIGPDVTYPKVVRRAVDMMLAESLHRRIDSPFGWIWSALHGATGKTPWVQLPDA